MVLTRLCTGADTFGFSYLACMVHAVSNSPHLIVAVGVHVQHHSSLVEQQDMLWAINYVPCYLFTIALSQLLNLSMW